MSVTTETEGLQREKAQLKKILRDMEDEEKYLVERLRVVEEKLEIQGLKEEMRAKGVVLDQLRSKVRELEGRLREPSAIQKASTTLVTEKVKEPQDEGTC